MAGLGTSLVHNLYPAEFAHVSRNVLNQQAMAAQGFAEQTLRGTQMRRRESVETEFMRANQDPGGDGSGYLPGRRKKGNAPQPHRLQQLAGEGALFDQRL